MAKTLFSPPRNKPKLSLPQPTVAVGQPMPMIQTINRPVNLVDDEGNVHGRLGENPNGPEQVTVSPPPGATGDPAGGPNYASGGTLLIGGGTPWSQEVTPEGGQGNSFTNTIGTGIFGTNWTPPVQQPAPQPQQKQMPVVGGGITSIPLQTLNPNAQIQQMQQQQLAAKRALLKSSEDTLDARAQTMPLRQNVTAAKSRVTGLQEAQNQTQRGVYQQENTNDQQRLGELQGIYAASKNIPDLTNVAEAQNLYNAQDRRASKMGVAPEATVDLPPEANPVRLPGVRPKIMSQEQRLTERAGYEDPIRNQQLQLAKNAVELQGTDVRAAQLAAERAGLTLEEANQLVNMAELRQSYYQLNENSADLNLAEAQQPPFPGAVRSAISGNWLTPEERDKERIDYQENVTQPYQSQVQSQGSQYAGLADSQLLNTIPARVNGGTVTEQDELFVGPIRAELIRRYMQQGLDQTQATEKANALIRQEFASRKSGTGLPEPVTPAGPPPAAAPSGQNTAQGPQLPPGYVP